MDDTSAIVSLFSISSPVRTGLGIFFFTFLFLGQGIFVSREYILSQSIDTRRKSYAEGSSVLSESINEGG